MTAWRPIRRQRTVECNRSSRRPRPRKQQQEEEEEESLAQPLAAVSHRNEQARSSRSARIDVDPPRSGDRCLKDLIPQPTEAIPWPRRPPVRAMHCASR